ncbi:AAA family ATPase, partial [Bacillus subtilis]|uniref:AAA family ATPase n=1 Tax=Bacillus subtilis TaxID=1423 RepID=UPI003C27D1EC
PMKILSGKLLRPDRTLIVGTPGIGKSSYGARTRKPIFLEAEVGANELDVARLRRDDGSPLETYAEACAAIDWLTNEPHEYETLVPDTL